MSAPALRRHGENVKPQYAQGAAGRSTDEERPDGEISGIVRRFKKKSAAGKNAVSLGLISKASESSLMYSHSMNIGLRGFAQFCGFFGIFFAILISVYARGIFSCSGEGLFSCLLFTMPSGVIFYSSSLILYIWSARLELFRPVDEPAIFDRKNRKVYRIFCEAQPGLWGLFKPWPMRAVEYDWDLIDAEHNAQIVTTGSTVRRNSSLVFIVRRSACDPTIIDSFNIGNSMLMGLEETVAATYEHIRRFMEENGPAIPPGEASPESKPTLGYWARIMSFSPLRRRYWAAWVDEFPMMLLIHVLFPVTVPLGALWLFFNWLSMVTSRPIEWPPEVIAAVGPEIAAPRSAQW